MIRRLALRCRDERARDGLAAAAHRAGVTVEHLSNDPLDLVALAGADCALRAPGGLVAAAVAAGAATSLHGPTARWFVKLGAEITGRQWNS